MAIKTAMPIANPTAARVQVHVQGLGEAVGKVQTGTKL
jgi:hypothetical protein